MNHGETRRPEEIQAEIEHTRDQMDSTLRAIEERLNPRHLMDQGMDYLRNSGGKEFVSNLRGSVKDNPLPVTLVGVGLAWLMAASKSTGTGSESSLSTRKLGESARGLGESARQRAQQVRGGYERIVQEQPLALGALGLAIGALLAASVPRTRKEDELMGPAKERLAERAKERIDEMKPESSTPEMPPKPKITVGIVETGPL